MATETTYRGITGGTLFTGFGLCDVGMAAAGIKAAWGVERDGAIAEVARANGVPVTTADVLACDPSRFEYVDVLHASPPCPSFSVAKTGGKETPLDVALGEKTADFVEALRPAVFTLENVWGYRKSESWRAVYRTLRRLGYGVGVAKINSADHGVPQTRERMIVWAVRDGQALPAPPPTHAEAPTCGGLFGHVPQRWNGWYAAVEDLLPTLPDSELAPWQIKRLPEELRTLLIMTGNTSDAQARPGVGIDDPDTPANSVYASGGQVRAVLVEQNANDTSGAAIWKDGTVPDGTVRTGANHLGRAILVGAGGYKGRVVQADGERPAFAVTANQNQADQVRALLLSANSVDGGEAASRDGGPPSVTVSTQGDRMRAVLISSQQTSGGERANLIRVDDESRAFVVPATEHKGIRKAILSTPSVRVVQMTPRALARFQTLPDWYALPDSRTLACRGIGNGVPCDLVTALYLHLLARVDFESLRRAA